ncbi:hypothetical protein HPB49_022520 [Dermacentor silvarum]|uniref:Uncharacterized protein n=1 Tax=Dermacentor silvarum TaxID=543639 RepID=A0ACB8D8C4_DERSI|nr:hypothetical protein HPB49_022520 [Dermacentor silvarum]
MSRDLHLTGPGCLPRVTKWKRCAGKIFHHPEKFLGAGNPKVAHVSAEEVGELRSANNDAVVEGPGAQERPPPIVATNPVASFEEAFAKYIQKSWKTFIGSSSRNRLRFTAKPGQSCF